MMNFVCREIMRVIYKQSVLSLSSSPTLRWTIVNIFHNI